MSLTRGTAARALRKKAHNSARKYVVELASTLLDPDLATEAKARRAAPARTAIAEAFDEMDKEGRKILADAGAAYLALQPSALRLAAAFKDPARAAAVRDLAEGMQPAELLTLAKMAAAERDGAAGYGLAAGLARLGDNAIAREAFEVLDAWRAEERAEARADLILTHAEVEQLSGDRRAAQGQRVDPHEMLRVANLLGVLPADRSTVTDPERLAAYKAAGLDFALADPAVLPESVPAGVGV